MRIGQGFDLHKLVENRPLILGGVIIPSNKGEEAHSDGDVLLHALIDALLGAKALGDIGTHFPPSDDEYKNISSVELLRRTLQLASFDIVNIDINIIRHINNKHQRLLFFTISITFSFIFYLMKYYYKFEGFYLFVNNRRCLTFS